MAAQSFAVTMQTWEALRTAVHDNAANLPDVQSALAAFEAIIPKIRELKARQDSLTAARQETTQLFKEQMAIARDLVLRLRAGVKFNLGPKNERLVQFRIAPLRKHARKATTKPTEAPGTPSPAAPKPAA